MNTNTSQNVNPLPHNEEYEQNILGCILIDGSLIEKISNQLDPEDFYKTRHMIIFRCMVDMQKKGTPIDILTIRNSLEKRGELEDVGESTYLTYLTEVSIVDANLDYYIHKVIELAQVRKISKKNELLRQAIEKGYSLDVIEKLTAEITSIEIRNTTPGLEIIKLSEQLKPEAEKWVLKDAIPDNFPTILYGSGGVTKSFLAIFLGIQAALGGQTFLGLKFAEEPLNTLLLDWELDINEVSRRSTRISNGLGLSNIPEIFLYASPTQSLQKLLPQIKSKIKTDKIEFLIIDSIGAACVDPDQVMDVIKVMTELRNLGIAVLILDHQSKLQSKDRYQNKTPYGSVYKINLSRSVFQLSLEDSRDNELTLMLRHKKSNFGKRVNDLTYDMRFQSDRIEFLESESLTPEQKELKSVLETIKELHDENIETTQTAIIDHSKFGRDKVRNLLEKAEGRHWEKRSRKGRGGGHIYIASKNFSSFLPLYIHENKKTSSKCPVTDCDNSKKSQKKFSDKGSSKNGNQKTSQASNWEELSREFIQTEAAEL